LSLKLDEFAIKHEVVQLLLITQVKCLLYWLVSVALVLILLSALYDVPWRCRSCSHCIVSSGRRDL